MRRRWSPTTTCSCPAASLHPHQRLRAQCAWVLRAPHRRCCQPTCPTSPVQAPVESASQVRASPKHQVPPGSPPPNRSQRRPLYAWRPIEWLLSSVEQKCFNAQKNNQTSPSIECEVTKVTELRPKTSKTGHVTLETGQAASSENARMLSSWH